MWGIRERGEPRQWVPRTDIGNRGETGKENEDDSILILQNLTCLSGRKTCLAGQQQREIWNGKSFRNYHPLGCGHESEDQELSLPTKGGVLLRESEALDPYKLYHPLIVL